MVDTIWLHRASDDGGIDYVCFRSCQNDVEIVEGYHLPPQMPLIKTRSSLGSLQARDRRDHFEHCLGYRHGPPVF
ncbi:hypothetical protein [Synechococcus sp. UW140]|uniref:hypothetical protein n=1 Tax=Synechococcus sp. UW140 TaxID=368503 RepID=UPI000E0FB715|nr:hypothetical protein [Synechococcus sp. UW140]